MPRLSATGWNFKGTIINSAHENLKELSQCAYKFQEESGWDSAHITDLYGLLLSKTEMLFLSFATLITEQKYIQHNCELCSNTFQNCYCNSPRGDQ